MRAIRAHAYGDSDVLVLADTAVPEPGPGQVRVRVHAAGVNPVETYIRTGTYAALIPDLPYTPGFDAAGLVDAIGDEVDGLAVGDRVFVAGRTLGSYAEYMVTDADTVAALPDTVTFAQGAALGTPGLAAHRALFTRGGLVAGETVLIHGGSGAVGHIAIQLAQAAGATVIGTAGSADGLAAIAALGVTAIDHTAPDHYDHVLEATDGRGANLIIEMLANENLADDFETLARYGRIIVVGNRGSLDFNPRLLMGKDADVRGIAVWNATPSERREGVEHLARALACGELKPLVGREFPLAEAANAQDYVMSSKALGKVVLTV